MKVVAYTALKYGKDYLGWAIRSVIDYVDEWHILYATQPSHGHYSAVPCPETEADLWAIASEAAGSKLRWHSGDWQQEGQQRNAIYEFAPDADAIISVDSDEIYSEKLITNLVKLFSAHHPFPSYYIRLPFIHYWRSFHRCILHDPAYPVRVTFPQSMNKTTTDFTSSFGVVNHMGYAIRPEIMRYKWLIHGHLPELRHDVNWYQDVFLANRQFDCHPVGSEWWNPEDVNPFNFMPEFMINHPFYGKKVIE
jgi:hypothetical protein